MIHKFLLVLSLSWSMLVKAQNTRQCGFDDVRQYTQNDSLAAEKHRADLNWWQYWRNANPGPAHIPTPSGVQNRSACVTTKRIIPVAVHVVHNGGAENISQGQIENAIEALNSHFANDVNTSYPAVNTGIQFVLARTEWVNSNLTNHRKNAQSIALMGAGNGMYNADTFINIWVVKTILTTWGNDTGVLGYATYPGLSYPGGKQGIVVRYNWFGTAAFGSPLDTLARGDVLAHECGHYLGLLHPFEGGCVGLNSTDCYLQGDLCCDVPAVIAPDQSCFSGPYNTCTENYNNNAPDQKQNYMDYSHPDCKNAFTADQTKLMFARIEQYRPSLGLPTYIPLGQPNLCIVAAKIDGATTACKGDSLVFFTYKYSGASYNWKLYKGSTLLQTYTGGFRFAFLRDTGIYTIYLYTIQNGKVAYDTLLNGVEVLDCKKRLPSTKGNWYMGRYAGINFASGKTQRDIGPFLNNTISNPNINTPEGTISMSDSNGNLLFYGGPCPLDFNNTNRDDSLRIFGKNYREIMGSPLLSNATSSQGPLAIPMPDSIGKYLVFQPQNGQSYFYRSVIDPYYQLIRGPKDTIFGRITRRNLKTSLPDSATLPRKVGEALTAIPKCNPKNHWLLVHNLYTGHIVVFSVAGDSVVYSHKFLTSNTITESQFVFNKQGTHFTFGKAIYNFNRCDGSISLFKDLVPDSLHSTWNTAWSNNGRILYRTEYIGYNVNTNADEYKIYQYNIENPASDLGRKLVTPTATERMMQLGPDKKLYIATDRQPYLAQINHADSINYNTTANQCGYEPVGVLLRKGNVGGLSYSSSIPNLINAEKETPKKDKFSFMIYRPNCSKIKVSPEICCASSFKWIWGDGTSSINRLDSHVYSSTGSFTVSLVINGTDTSSRQVYIGIPPSHLTPLGPDTVCYNSIQQIYTGPTFLSFPYYKYLWKVTNGSISNMQENRADFNLNIGHL